MDEENRSDELEDLISYIDLVADMDELKDIQQHITAKFSYLLSLQKIVFSVGDRVGFHARGTVIVGQVSKIMRKTIKVTTDTGEWVVRPELLERLDD